MMDWFRRACGHLSNLANQRQVIEIMYFQTLDVTHTCDYATEIDNSLLNNLDFVIKTALSEAALVSQVHRFHKLNKTLKTTFFNQD
jgi:hypothetical protein